MPCIIEKRFNNANNVTCGLIYPYGRISSTLPLHQLIPMFSAKPTELQNIDFETIQTVLLIKASKMFARGNATATATCDCETKCVQKTCTCRRISVACSTKCHSKFGKCKNIE